MSVNLEPVDVEVIMRADGVIVVPVALRQRLGIEDGEPLRLHTEGNRLVVERKKNPLDNIIGVFKLPHPPSENFRDERAAAWEQVARERVERMKNDALPE